MANKIATSLPLAELRALCDELAAASGEPTLKQIQDAAAARGVRISLMAATSFRDSTFEGYLAELRRKREAADLIAEAASAGASQSDAAAALLNQQMLDRLMAGEQFAPEEFAQTVLNVSRLRAGDQAGKKLRADLALAEKNGRLKDEQLAKAQNEAAERAERNAKAKAALDGLKSKGGLTAATLKQIEEAASLL